MFKSIFPVSTLVLLCALSQYAAAQNEQLVIFIDNSTNPVAQHFKNEVLPSIQEMAQSSELEVVVKNVSDGVPPEIAFTPAIVYQNALGRAFYVGRYTYVDKIKTFIRTVRRVPQKQAVNNKDNTPVLQLGKATIVGIQKITPLTGNVEAGFDQDAFIKKAKAAMGKRFEQFTMHKEFGVERLHRMFYMNFYPYQGSNGTKCISMELYSQFNCIEPIYVQLKTPLCGKWETWEEAFGEAGCLLEKEIIRQISSTEKGDGFVPLKPKVIQKTWEQLGLPLPQPSAEDKERLKAMEGMTVAQKWTVEGPVDDETPVVNFHFQVPVDYYAGEITSLSGSLNLSSGSSLNNAKGTFKIAANSLTMGDKMMDESIMKMIKATEFPMPEFTFGSIDIQENAALAFGVLSQFSVTGSLALKGITKPINVVAQIMPVLNEDGEPRLEVFASFTLTLKDNYDINGPDGPSPANDTMEFYLNFLMKPS